MRQIPALEMTWPYKATAILIAVGGLAVFFYRSLDTHLWTDEFLSLALIKATNLPTLWVGIARGIDGNPPLFFTVAWILTQFAPGQTSAIIILRVMNLSLTIAATFILYRLSLRMASRLAAWIGVLIFVALNTNLTVLATELRTYAFYYFTAALAMLLQQRVNERGRIVDAVLLAIGYVALTLSHTFGFVYVVCIATAAILSTWQERWSRLRLTAYAAVPALVTIIAWLPCFFLQSEVGKPYLWITPPDFGQLLLIMWSTPLSMWIAIIEFIFIATSIGGALWIHGDTARRAMLSGQQWQFSRYVVGVTASLSAFTFAVWIASKYLFPIFVPRYFVPQVIVTFALHVTFCELILRALNEHPRFSMSANARWAAVALPALFAVILLQHSNDGQDRCTDANNQFFETAYVQGDLPVIADSPHIFLPRSYYAANGGAYRFPLDWDVVLKYPLRDRGNATDFHIFEILKTWLPMPSVVTTDEIVRDYRQFLVIESDRAWFDNLKLTQNVSAEKLAEVVTPYGGACTLWKVASIKAKTVGALSAD